MVEFLIVFLFSCLNFSFIKNIVDNLILKLDLLVNLSCLVDE